MTFDDIYSYLINSEYITEAIKYMGHSRDYQSGSDTEKEFAVYLEKTYGPGFFKQGASNIELNNAYNRFLRGEVNWHQATKEQETKEHYDFGVRGLEAKDKVTKIEVKGNKDVTVGKALQRLGIDNPDKGIFVELQGGTGHPGWALGNADFIAFKDNRGGFILWSLKHIKDEIKRSNLLNAPIVGKPEEAVYKRYQRYGSKDYISIISADKVKELGGIKTRLT